MESVEKLQRMEDQLVARIAALEERGKSVPYHYRIWLCLIADALLQHRRKDANAPLIC
ncbi:MAG: hypothetical protein ACE5G0_22920 [Rhodothermales bacterium]